MGPTCAMYFLMYSLALCLTLELTSRSSKVLAVFQFFIHDAMSKLHKDNGIVFTMSYF